MSARSARRITKNARPQVSKSEREAARTERVLLGSQGSGVHRDQTYRHGGKNARGGRGQGERRALADAR